MSRFVPLDVLRDDYARTMDYYKTLADIRFKLLGLVPVVTILAGGLLGKPTSGRSATLGVGALGLVATLGVVVYEIRNSQLHDAAVHRLKHLEHLLDLPPSTVGNGRGVFSERPQRPALVGPVRLWHDLALGMVYGVSTAGWTWLVAGSVWQLRPGPATFWLQIGSPVVVGFLVLSGVIHLSRVGRPAGQVFLLPSCITPERDAAAALTQVLHAVAGADPAETGPPLDPHVAEQWHQLATSLGLVHSRPSLLHPRGRARLEDRGARFLAAADAAGRQQVLDEAVFLLQDVRQLDDCCLPRRPPGQRDDDTGRGELVHDILSREAGCPRWLTQEQVERRLRLIEGSAPVAPPPRQREQPSVGMST